MAMILMIVFNNLTKMKKDKILLHKILKIMRLNLMIVFNNILKMILLIKIIRIKLMRNFKKWAIKI